MFDHLNHTSFDGEGKPLAHAISNKFNRSICIDMSERWTVLSFMATFIHESLHILGLPLNDSKNSIRYKFIQNKYKPTEVMKPN